MDTEYLTKSLEDCAKKQILLDSWLHEKDFDYKPFTDYNVITAWAKKITPNMEIIVTLQGNTGTRLTGRIIRQFRGQFDNYTDSLWWVNCEGSKRPLSDMLYKSIQKGIVDSKFYRQSELKKEAKWGLSE